MQNLLRFEKGHLVEKVYCKKYTWRKIQSTHGGVLLLVQ